MIDNNIKNRGKGGRGRMRQRRREKSEYEHKVLDIARVTRVTKGGKRFRFRATVVVGDEKGKIGFGLSQGKDVAQAVQKALNKGTKDLYKINTHEGTIPHDILYKFKSAIVLLKRAKVGHGIKAGGPIRAIAQLVGLKNLTGKLISRTNNKINIARAAIGALKQLKTKNVEDKTVVKEAKEEKQKTENDKSQEEEQPQENK